MLRKIICSIALATVASVNAAGVETDDVFVDVYDDVIAFELMDDASDMQLSISGPNGFSQSGKHKGSQLAFVEVSPFGQEVLADGVYKYEIKAIPTSTISLEESMAMPDRNKLSVTQGQKYSPVSGSFRVKNGKIVDDQAQETADLKDKEVLK